jgi:hypothetical protein
MKPLSRQQRLQLAAQATAEPTMLPSPSKGWNTRDAFDSMDPLEAVLLDNWFPDAGGVKLRNGFASYATGMGASPVSTLAEFNSGSTRKFIAAANGKFFDVSAAGAVGAPLATGFTSDHWQTESFNSRLFFVNGVDTAQVYDGSIFANSDFTGVTLSTLFSVIQYQQRLFFLQSNSTKFWYGALNAIGASALLSYDLGGWAPKGGNIIAVTTYSHDGGNGVQDFIVFIMGGGDALIFFGNDPGNLNAWAEVGRYRISPPVSPRAVCQYGAEAFITTYDDHVPLQQQLVALKLGQLPPRSKVSNAVQAAVQANGSAFGWQALYYPRGRRLIFNIPNPDGSFDQHVCNTGSNEQAWTRFRGMNAFCWGLFKDKLYFGAAGGIVYQADVGTLDNAGPVNGVAQQAWNTFGSAQRKKPVAFRPLVQTVGNSSLTAALGFDYGTLNVPVAVAISTGGSPWDTSPWDTSPWSADSGVTTGWHAAAGSGVSISVGVSIAGNNGAIWLRTDLKGETGATL